MKINITGALKKGKITKKELAAKLWPGSKCQYQNFRHLENDTTKPTPEQTEIIYKECGVDPNFLYGFKKAKFILNLNRLYTIFIKQT